MDADYTPNLVRIARRFTEQFIPILLPTTIRDLLAPQFARATAVLDAAPDNPLRHWANCVRVVPREMPLLAPQYNNDALRVVYNALLAGKRFIADYRSRATGSDEITSYEVSALGLIARGQVLYVVCTLWNYQDVRQLALHRVVSAALTEKPVTNPDGFDLDRYIEQGEFQYPVGPTIELKAKFNRAAAAHLVETPLNENQTIKDLDADFVLVTATVRDTAQLDWWISGFGPLVEIMAPIELRDRMVAAAYSLNEIYRDQGISQSSDVSR